MSCFCTVGPGFNWEVLVLQDYPSIAHLVQKLSDHNIQTIFAVTEEFQPVYKVNVCSDARLSLTQPVLTACLCVCFRS